MVRDSVARLVDERILPVIQKHFEEHTFPRDLVPEIASLGLLGSSISGYGCAGMNAVAYGLICQELERGDSGIRSFVSVQSSLCMYPILAFGSEAQREKYLPRMATGELIGCFGLTEPHGGSDPANMKTHAKRRGKDWVLNGAKMWITNAPIADLAIVWAKTAGRYPRLHRREGHARVRRSRDRAQVLAARLRDRRPVLRGRRRAGREHASRQHDRPQGAALLPDAGALRHHLGRDRRRAGLPRTGDRLHQDARTLRAAAGCRTRRSRSVSPRWHAASPARS